MGETVPYKRNIFEGKHVISRLLVSMDNRSRRLSYPKITNYGRSFSPDIVYWRKGVTQSLGRVSAKQNK